MPHPVEPSDALPDFLRLEHAIEGCGWVEEESRALGCCIDFQSFQGPRDAPCRVWRGALGQRLVAIALPDVKLAGETDLFPRFIDLPLESRMALALVRAAGAFDWLLLLTQDRLDLHRLPSERLDARATNRAELEEDLLPHLAALAKGRNGRTATESSALSGAESLAGWIRHWTSTLGAAINLEKARSERLLWQWILMLQVARRTQGSELNQEWGLHARTDGAGGWVIGYEAASATQELCNALAQFETTFSSWLFEPAEDDDIIARLQAIDETSLLDRLRAELLMHSQDRFEPESIAWLFTDLAREQEGWRREVRGVEPIRARLQHEGWTVYQPLICDVEAFGLSAALKDCERLAEYFDEVNQYLLQRRNAGAGAAQQPDMFHPNPHGIGQEGLLNDGVNYLFGEALRLKGVEPERRLGVAVVFLLKGLQLSVQMNWPFFGVDTLEDLFAADAARTHKLHPGYLDPSS